MAQLLTNGSEMGSNGNPSDQMGSIIPGGNLYSHFLLKSERKKTGIFSNLTSRTLIQMERVLGMCLLRCGYILQNNLCLCGGLCDGRYRRPHNLVMLWLICSRWWKCSTKVKCRDSLRCDAAAWKIRRFHVFAPMMRFRNLIRSVLSLSVCQSQLRREVLWPNISTHTHTQSTGQIIGVNKEGACVGELIDHLLDKNDFLAQKQDLITSQLRPAVIVLLLDSGRSVQEGRGDLMNGDRGASSASQSWLQELDPIDCLLCLWIHFRRSSGSFYWFELCSALVGKRPCRGAGLAGFVCCCHVSVVVCWRASFTCCDYIQLLPSSTLSQKRELVCWLVSIICNYFSYSLISPAFLFLFCIYSAFI